MKSYMCSEEFELRKNNRVHPSGVPLGDPCRSSEQACRMIPRREVVAQNLAAAVSRLDVVLNPWGFAFVDDDIQSSHCGPFASGHYCRDTTRIGISCRDTIDNIYYEHAFIKKNLYDTETERFTIGHDTLMRALGHAEDCSLVCIDQIPDAIVARDGGDRVAALIRDLTTVAFTLLRKPCDEFYAIMRHGGRAYSVAKNVDPGPGRTAGKGSTN